MKEALVIGAGIVGVSTALALQERGWTVTVIDRKEPGSETSFGNAGILQREAVAPYAMPLGPGFLLGVLLGRRNDVRARWRELALQAGALLRYGLHSTPARHAVLSAAYESLIRTSLAAHRDFIDASGAESLIRRSGYREYFRDPRLFEAAARRSEEMAARHGLNLAIMDAAALQAAEPAIADPGAGAVHWLDPWSVSDPGRLTTAYAAVFVARGGRIVRAEVTAIRATATGWSAKAWGRGWSAPHLVLAAGPWTPRLLAGLGIRVPMVYKRGYHRHYAAPVPLHVPMLDTDHGYVATPVEQGLRITTGAHLARLHLPPDYAQLARAEAAARDILDIGRADEIQPWTGTRPCLPDMLPLIGESARLPRLWVNFGHGHQGLTLGPASGHHLAALMSNEPPPAAPEPFLPARYGF